MSEPTPLLAPLKPATAPPRLWTSGRFVANAWQFVADGDALEDLRPAFVSVARWRRERALLSQRSSATGVRVEPGDTFDVDDAGLAQLASIALVFPKFSDGRAYSTAQRLRASGYAGEIRAVGDVLLDQLPLMLRSGFNAFEIADAATQRALDGGKVPGLSHVYQGGRNRAAAAG